MQPSSSTLTAKKDNIAPTSRQASQPERSIQTAFQSRCMTCTGGSCCGRGSKNANDDGSLASRTSQISKADSEASAKVCQIIDTNQAKGPNILATSTLLGMINGANIPKVNDTPQPNTTQTTTNFNGPQTTNSANNPAFLLVQQSDSKAQSIVSSQLNTPIQLSQAIIFNYQNHLAEVGSSASSIFQNNAQASMQSIQILLRQESVDRQLSPRAYHSSSKMQSSNQPFLVNDVIYSNNTASESPSTNSTNYSINIAESPIASKMQVADPISEVVTDNVQNKVPPNLHHDSEMFQPIKFKTSKKTETQVSTLKSKTSPKIQNPTVLRIAQQAFTYQYAQLSLQIQNFTTSLSSSLLYSTNQISNFIAKLNTSLLTTQLAISRNYLLKNIENLSNFANTTLAQLKNLSKEYFQTIQFAIKHITETINLFKNPWVKDHVNKLVNNVLEHVKKIETLKSIFEKLLAKLNDNSLQPKPASQAKTNEKEVRLPINAQKNDEEIKKTKQLKNGSKIKNDKKAKARKRTILKLINSLLKPAGRGARSKNLSKRASEPKNYLTLLRSKKSRRLLLLLLLNIKKQKRNSPQRRRLIAKLKDMLANVTN